MARCEIELLAPNVMKVFLADRTILFSYTTPVALTVHKNGTTERYAIDRTESRTTAGHLNKFGPEKFLLEGDHFEKVSPPRLKELIAED